MSNDDQQKPQCTKCHGSGYIGYHRVYKKPDGSEGQEWGTKQCDGCGGSGRQR